MKDKRNRKRKLIAMLLTGILLVGMTACGNSTSGINGMAQSAPSEMKGDGFHTVDFAETEEYAYDTSIEQPMQDKNESSAAISREIDRKLVYTAYVDLESRDYESAIVMLRQQVESCNGYMEETSQYGSKENGNRYYDVTIRIPSEQYRSFLDATGSMGSVTHVSESMQDVTTNYIDIQARISSLEEQRERLSELRKQAGSLEDLLAIENRMSDVQYQLDNYMGQMKYLQQQVSYSTVYLSLREVVEYTPANTFVSRLKRALTGTWSDFFSAMGELLIGVIYLIPYLLLLAVAVFAIKRICRHIRNKKAEKKQETEE